MAWPNKGINGSNGQRKLPDAGPRSSRGPQPIFFDEKHVKQREECARYRQNSDKYRQFVNDKIKTKAKTDIHYKTEAEMDKQAFKWLEANS